MTSPNWGLLNQGGGFQNALATGLKLGADARERREEADRKNALAAYAANPDDPTAVQGVVRADPKLGIPIIKEQRERREEVELGQLTQRALQGDQEAMGQLATRNFDRWKALGAEQRQAAEQKAKVLGNAAMDVLNRPAEQRRAAVVAYAQQLGGQFPGVTQLAQLPDDQLEAALRGAVAEAGMVEKLISMEQPDQFNIEPGGARYERDPRTGEIRTVIAPNYGGAPAFSQAPPKQTKQLGGKTYIQDANGDWYEDDGGATPGGSPTFRP